jgi:ParB-like chromosome segregation protein Spo0J
MTLTLAISGASLMLALSGILISLYIFKNGLQDLQRSQTAVQLQTERKLVSETVTADAEAKFSQMLSEARAINEVLRTTLTKSQTLLNQSENARAIAEAGRADAETKLAKVDSDLKNITLSMNRLTTGDPEFQAVVGRLFKQYVIPAADCVGARPGESPEAFKKRCDGKGIEALFKDLGGSKKTEFPYLTPPTLERWEVNAKKLNR